MKPPLWLAYPLIWGGAAISAALVVGVLWLAGAVAGGMR